MSFAAETTITVPSGAVQIAELRAGDMVLAAGLDLQWQQYTVKTAEAASSERPMFSIALGTGKSIVVTADQLFLTPHDSLKRADELRRGDQLLGGGGQRIAVVDANNVAYPGTVCEIATSSESPTDGHLLEANGVIAGDYDLQVERNGA